MKTDKKILSTIWLDFISFIFIPFYILVNSNELFKAIKSKNILLIIYLIICIIYSIILLFNLVKKNKISYYMLYIFLVLSFSSIMLYLIPKLHINNIWYIVEIIGVSLIIWLVPNIIYLYRRQNIFKDKLPIAHIKKCPGCNRIIPVNMTSCGKCSYKEK